MSEIISFRLSFHAPCPTWAVAGRLIRFLSNVTVDVNIAMSRQRTKPVCRYKKITIYIRVMRVNVNNTI